MIPAIVVIVYLTIVVLIGAFAYSRSKNSGEDYFLASRSIGQYIFLLSLFGTNMTAFAILGSSGMAYQRGIGVYGLMASSSGLIIPLTLFFIGTRLWWLGKRFGHMTQVQLFRDRWECSGIGTFIFVLTAAMLVPYILIGVMGGGNVLEALSTVMGPDGKPVMVATMVNGQSVMQAQHFVSYEMGGALVVLAVTLHLFMGGMRGAVWVNTFQTVLFLCFGAVAVYLIGRRLGGYDHVMQMLAASPKTAPLLTRARIPQAEFFSYMFIPLSSIMFPHMAIMCLSAKKVSAFKKTVVAYPICILLIWLPSVFLGVVAASQFPGLPPGQTNDVILRLLAQHTDTLVAGLLGAGIMSCVMSSDSHQILALCTMFTRDIFIHYGGKERFGEKAQVWTGRLFVVFIALISYLIALKLKNKEGIFDIAVRFAFSGYAALAPMMIAALFWKRSTKWGAFATTLWVTVTMLGTWYLFSSSAGIVPKPGQPPVQLFPALGDMFLRTPANVTIYGMLPVVPMCIGSAIVMIVVSLLTAPPSRATIDRYFPAKA